MGVSALVVAAGSGTRLPGGVPKGLRAVGGRPLFLHSLQIFAAAPAIDGMVLVVPEAHVEECLSIVRASVEKAVRVLAGGKRRQDSVLKGLEALAGGAAGSGEEGRLIAVHDAARPFVDAGLLARLIEAAAESGAALPVVPIVDTVRELGDAGPVVGVADRSRLFATQTPQVGRLDWLLAGYRRALAAGLLATDEGVALSLAGHPSTLVPGAPGNFKITTAEDLRTAEALLAGPADPLALGLRIGYGEDRHPSLEERPFVLAGIQIAPGGGPSGHSDGDPLCHALVDALLGAASAGSIGDHFPDTDPRWKGAAGLDLLRAAMALVAARGLAPVNADAVLVFDRPPLAPHAGAVAQRVAEVLGLPPDRVAVKAKRSEGLGFEADGRAVSCRAVVLLGRGAPP